MLTTRERKALETARDADGVNRGEMSSAGIGEKTINDLIGRRLLERFAHPVARDRLMFRTTDAGKAAVASPAVPVAGPARAKLTMLKPLVPTIDTSIARPLKPRR